MKIPDQQIPSALPGAEEKIKQYEDQIRSGQDKKVVLEGLPDSFRNAVEARLLEDQRGLEEVRERIENSGNDQKTPATINMRDVENGYDGDIILEGKNVGHFTLRRQDEKKYYMQDIQIGYSDDETAQFRGKGHGEKAYQEIIRSLARQEKQLVSTSWETSQSAISPQALRVWEKLEKSGYARIAGYKQGKIHDRFTGETRVEQIPLYESMLPQDN